MFYIGSQELNRTSLSLIKSILISKLLILLLRLIEPFLTIGEARSDLRQLSSNNI